MDSYTLAWISTYSVHSVEWETNCGDLHI